MRLLHSIPCVLFLLLTGAGMTATAAQTSITTNEYRITDGHYAACCGIAGPVTSQLPTDDQTSVLLIINHDNLQARMFIVGLDGSVAHELNEGRVQTDYIEFGLPVMPGPRPPLGGPPAYHYIVSNTAAGLRFNGLIVYPIIGADVFNRFTHTNVVATPIHIDPPPLTIHVSEVQICWPSVLGQNYLVQYFPAATGSGWGPLGPPVTGNGTTNCVSDTVTPGQRHRIYRILVLPVAAQDTPSSE